MARIPDAEIERLKNEVAVQRLVEASGLELKKSGKDWVTRCPFHEDDTASLVVTPAKLLDNLRVGTPKHLYLPTREGRGRGVFNIAALMASKEVIFCEALIDALTFWCAGYHNVTSSYGIEGFTCEHIEAFKRHGTQRVLIAYDRDEAGERGAAKVAERLMSEGIECFRISSPKAGRQRVRLEGAARRQVAGLADPQGRVAGQGSRASAAGGCARHRASG